MNIRSQLYRIHTATTLVLLTIVVPVSLFVPQKVSGAELTFRSLAIGTSTSGAATNYRFNFNTTTAATIGSIVFEVCSNSPLFDVACTAPTGFNASSTRDRKSVV